MLKGPLGITTDPGEVDAIARQVWGEIYKGNSLDKWATAKAFAQVYDPFISKRSEFILKDITAKDVLTAYTSSKKTAPGPDCWDVQDAALMTEVGAQRLADL